MASVNKVILVGNLGQDPESRFLPDGSAVANISVATSEKWKGKDGSQQEHTEWHRVSFFGKLAEVVSQYCKKGQSVYIEGRIRTEKWTDKNGNDRYASKIIADRMQMLGKKDDAPETPASQPAAPTKPAKKPYDGKGGFDDMDDDIPFRDPYAGGAWRFV